MKLAASHLFLCMVLLAAFSIQTADADTSNTAAAPPQATANIALVPSTGDARIIDDLFKDSEYKQLTTYPSTGLFNDEY